MSVIVRLASDNDASAWDRYVFNHPRGTFCHRYGWKRVVEEGAGQKCPFLIVEKNDIIVGVLPISIRNSLLFGKACSSMMFAVYGGPLADDEEALTALNEAAWGIAKEAGSSSLEYKTVQGSDSAEWCIEENVAATFLKPLAGDADTILLDIPRKQRAVVRKTLKSGLTCKWEHNLDGFYALYAESVRNLGTPVFPKKLFAKFIEVFKSDLEIQIISSPDGKPVASLMSFYYKDHVLPYYAGGSLDARKYGAHDYMYYQLMVRASERGRKIFDFGRSKVGTGPYKFKKNWGFEPTQLQYQYKLAEGAEKPSINPQNKKFELLVRIWKKLPLPVANLLGPSLARHLG